MKLSNVCDEDLKEVAKLKTIKGTYTSDAKRAQQILRSRNLGRIGMRCHNKTTNLDVNFCRDYKSFAEENFGLTLAEYLEKEKERLRNK